MQTNLWRSMFNRRMLICIAIGFSSGFPFYVLSQLSAAWLSEEGVDVKTLGLITLTQLPYIWKFVWSPLLDRYVPPFLGRRRGWMLITQIVIMLLIAVMGLLNPQMSLSLVVVVAIALSFFSASQDIALDAYRRELLTDNEMGMGTAYHVSAYRYSSFLPGGLGLILLDVMSTQWVFLVMSSFMLIGIVTTFLIKETSNPEYAPLSIKEAVVQPFVEFFSRQNLQMSIYILLFLVLYKLGDNMATALQTKFYLDVGFSATEIGAFAKTASLASTVAGMLLGGIIMLKLGLYRSLWVFGFVQIVSILGFAALSEIGDNQLALVLVQVCEYLGAGLGTVGLLAFMQQQSNLRFTATQFALLSSLATTPRVLAGSTTGYIIDAVGYTHFFLICFLCAIPGLLILFKIAPIIHSDQEQGKQA